MIDRIHIIVALLAALAVTILSLYQDVEFYTACVRLVIVIPIFFIVGLLLRLYLKKLFAPPPPKDVEALENEHAEDDLPAEEPGSYDEQEENYDEI